MRIENTPPVGQGQGEQAARSTNGTSTTAASFGDILQDLQRQMAAGEVPESDAEVIAEAARQVVASGRLDPSMALSLILGNTTLGDWSESGLTSEWSLPAISGGLSLSAAAGQTSTRARPARGAAADQFRTLQPYFLQAEQQTGVPWQIQAAQWALETGWGRATPKDLYTGQESFNLFGIKGDGPAGSIRAMTTEVVNGQPVKQMARFRAYNSYGESVVEHARLLTTPYYAKAFAAGSDLQAWADQLGPQHLGYATDPDYSRKLMQIIQENGWDQ